VREENQMSVKKNGNWFNSGVALAIGLVISSLIFGWFYSTSKKGDEAITVTGSDGERFF
jgi:hypothetical protein